MITTKELAELAGVNQSTVSRSLSNSQHISKETRDKIQELAKAHGYTKNKKKSSHSNGGIVIILNAKKMQNKVLDLYIEHLCNHVIEQTEAHNYFSIILSDDGSEKALKHIISVIKSGVSAGVVIINDDYNAALEEALGLCKIPRVYTQYFSRPMKKSVNVIDMDHFAGGLIATKHLISLGHTRIATLTNVGSSDFSERTTGYLTALEENSIPSNADWIIDAGLTYPSGYKSLEMNWDKISDCTAFFAQTDPVAFSLINFLKDRGFSVPEQYSVMGFDGLQEGIYFRPELSTVVQPIDEIAKMSLNRLTRLIDQEDTKATHSFVQPKLLLRASTAPPLE
ncbi:DNA-binding LacI/PurR family transcriptional regulator [Aequitasia blattaphilus]|uniref:LacI family transcriptional regulator n=1 Tax=Aequitasia blattaphilus TaxID=2949332 RepID=A0ABT1E6V7_9FIRM|nr:LacI family DNA-binding transcriptional regulator [Aequitasia blattaphilus]MCP1101565.1 LacI family transcriptional regulator [Aequitasia blattaphilus]MCR8614205.1 LacI family transcriptional regulator [Aequitasia blattaphilus]